MAMVCRDDDRFVVGVGLDMAAYGVYKDDIKTPILILSLELNYNLNAVIGANNSEETYYALIKDAVHYDFCDFMFTSSIEALDGPRDELEMRDIVTSYTKTYFDKHLLKKAVEIESLTFDGIELIKKPKK